MKKKETKSRGNKYKWHNKMVSLYLNLSLVPLNVNGLKIDYQ